MTNKRLAGRRRSFQNRSTIRSISLGVLALLLLCALPIIAGRKAFSSAILESHHFAFPPTQTTASNAIPANDPDTNVYLPDGSADYVNPQGPLDIIQAKSDDIGVLLIAGGSAGTRRSPVREGVDQFIKESGATAGLNGTFFANASVQGTDNLLIGPSICGNEQQPVLSPFDRKPSLDGRPMVLIGPTRTRIVPYNSAYMDSLADMKALMPSMTDAFLGGVWLVHNGVAADDDRMASFHVRDANDPRRRAFFAIMPDGRPALGATTFVARSKDLAQALADAGIKEAVLLDSGFSTSLVFQDKILITGHTSPGIPSRPVPQAILLFGSPSATAATVADQFAQVHIDKNKPNPDI